MVKSSVGMVKASRLLRFGGLGGSGCTGAGAGCTGAGAGCNGAGGVGGLISGAVNGVSMGGDWLGCGLAGITAFNRKKRVRRPS